ncbi:hypothetical protein E143388_07580 [Rhodococcus opacus]|nr:hypothetical protein E143388_07580 [Rhodococcus opacus]
MRVLHVNGRGYRGGSTPLRFPRSKSGATASARVSHPMSLAGASSCIVQTNIIAAANITCGTAVREDAARRQRCWPPFNLVISNAAGPTCWVMCTPNSTPAFLALRGSRNIRALHIRDIAVVCAEDPRHHVRGGDRGSVCRASVAVNDSMRVIEQRCVPSVGMSSGGDFQQPLRQRWPCGWLYVDLIPISIIVGGSPSVTSTGDPRLTIRLRETAHQCLVVTPLLSHP